MNALSWAGLLLYSRTGWIARKVTLRCGVMTTSEMQGGLR